MSQVISTQPYCKPFHRWQDEGHSAPCCHNTQLSQNSWLHHNSPFPSFPACSLPCSAGPPALSIWLALLLQTHRSECFSLQYQSTMPAMPGTVPFIGLLLYRPCSRSGQNSQNSAWLQGEYRLAFRWDLWVSSPGSMDGSWRANELCSCFSCYVFEAFTHLLCWPLQTHRSKWGIFMEGFCDLLCTSTGLLVSSWNLGKSHRHELFRQKQIHEVSRHCASRKGSHSQTVRKTFSMVKHILFLQAGSTELCGWWQWTAWSGHIQAVHSLYC